MSASVAVDEIPAELRERSQWVLWRLEERDGKPTKVPRQVANPTARASVSDPATWGTFEEAVELLGLGVCDGIGYVFAANDPYCGVDLDSCLAQGRLHHSAAAIVSALGSYCEVSPSGGGVHVFVRAALNGHPRKRTRKTAWAGEFEAYDEGRFFCVTGRHLRGTPTAVEPRQRELGEVLRLIFPPEPERARPPVAPVPVDLEDRELLERARRARDGERFAALFDRGDTSRYDGDDSRADAALVSKLVFWTGGDATRADRLFRSSALMREKWDSRRGDQTYGELTIARTLERATEFYSPPASRPRQYERPRVEKPGRSQAPGAAAGTGAAEAQAWTESVASVATFPLDAIPPELRGLAVEAEVSLPAPADFVAVPGLAVLATEIGNSRVLEVKRGYQEGARLTVAVVAEPGTRKSPAQRYAVKPLEHAQRRFAEEYKRALEEYQVAEAVHFAEDKAWRNKANGKGDGPVGEAPVKPVPPRMALAMVTDSTWEAIGEALVYNPRGVAYSADELTGWVRGMNQYRSGKGADRQHYLSAWSGASIVINRKGKEPFYIERPFITILGGLTPDILGELEDERGREDGFLHRVLFSYPDPIATVWTDQGVSEEAVGRYLLLASRLRQLEGDESGLPRIVRFTPTGGQAFAAFLRDDHYPAMNAAPAILRGPYAKLEAYVARFALVLQCCRHVSDGVGEDVDEVSVEAAAKLVRYFRSHAGRVYWRLHATQEELGEERFLNWVRTQGGVVTIRQVQRSEVLGRKKVDEIRAELEAFVEAGIGRLEQRQTTAGRPTEIFSL